MAQSNLIGHTLGLNVFPSKYLGQEQVKDFIPSKWIESVTFIADFDVKVWDMYGRTQR